MAGNESSNELNILDLDGLILEPPRILLPHRVVVELRDLTRDELLAFLRQVDEIERDNPQRIAVRYADLLATIAVDPADALPKLDDMTFVHVILAMRWLRDPQTAVFDASERRAIGAVKQDGKMYDVLPITVGTSRLLAQRAAVTEGGAAGRLSPVDEHEYNLTFMAHLIDGIPLARLQQMTTFQRAPLARYLSEQLQRHFEELTAGTGGGANPTLPTARPSRGRRPR